MAFKENNEQFSKSIAAMINEKMKVLDDFGVCSKNDPEMRAKLREAIESQPNRDPRTVIDQFCRPLIQTKIRSWL